jgi:hypothetical protein
VRSGCDENEQGSASLEGLVREIVAMAAEMEHAREAAPRDIENDFESIARRDYGGCLKLNFSRRELSGILEAFRTAVPKLDREQFKPMSLPRLANVASSLGLKFRADPFDGPGGAGLRGFYVATKALKQPLICLNTAHHRTAINAAFWHEMGHHLTARLLSPQEGSMALSFGSDFDEHLNDPRELAADMLVSLVCYSHSAAKRHFGVLLRKGSAENIDMVVSAVRNHLSSVWGFNFDKQIPATQNLHYLAGMIHFAKLRLALLAGCDI